MTIKGAQKSAYGAADLTAPSAPEAPASAPDEIWLGPAQRAALEHVFARRGHKHIEGPPACGKTTLVRYAQRSRPGDIVLGLPGPKSSPRDVLAGLLHAADLGPWELDEPEQRNLFTLFVSQRRAEHKRVIVLVDDAHRFSAEAWRELERLSLLRDFAGEPMLELTAVTRTGLAPPFMIGRGMVTHAMQALSAEDLRGYCRWRVGRFFELTDEAAQLAHTIGAGHYGAVDALLQLAIELNGEPRTPIDTGAIRAAARSLAERPAALMGAASAHENQPVEPEATQTAPAGRLLVMYHGNVIRSVPLQARLLLGRGQQCDVTLGNVDVSRFHAAIIGTPEKLFVVDLNSKNGVLLNGTPIGRVELCDRDILTIGPFHVRVALDEAAQTEVAFAGRSEHTGTATLTQRFPARRSIRPVK